MVKFYNATQLLTLKLFQWNIICSLQRVICVASGEAQRSPTVSFGSDKGLPLLEPQQTDGVHSVWGVVILKLLLQLLQQLNRRLHANCAKGSGDTMYVLQSVSCIFHMNVKHRDCSLTFSNSMFGIHVVTHVMFRLLATGPVYNYDYCKHK